MLGEWYGPVARQIYANCQKGTCIQCAHYRDYGLYAKCERRKPYTYTDAGGTCSSWEGRNGEEYATQGPQTSPRAANRRSGDSCDAVYRHGSYNRFMAGCTCDACAAAGANATADTLQRYKTFKRMQGDYTDPLHGTITGYNAGCRCPRCVDAFAIYKMGIRPIK